MGLLYIVSLFLMIGSQQALALVEFGDPCYIITWSNLSGDAEQVINATIPQDCLSGQIDWNYPKGLLLLKVTSVGKNFSLCVEQSWSMHLSGVNDVTEGANKILPIPTTDEPSCAVSSNGEARLLLTAPRVQLYLIPIGYRITPINNQ